MKLVHANRRMNDGELRKKRKFNISSCREREWWLVLVWRATNRKRRNKKSNKKNPEMDIFERASSGKKVNLQQSTINVRCGNVRMMERNCGHKKY
jgi:hypothetical protein